MKRIKQFSYPNMVSSGLTLLILWCCTSFGFALDEIKHVVFYRVEMPASIFSADALMPGASHQETEAATLVLHVLLAKDDCVVERLGKVAVVNGEFNLDQTKAVYYFQPNGAGDYSFKTHQDKVGLQAKGTVSKSGEYYSILLDLSRNEIANRVAMVNNEERDTDAAHFINEAHIGMPEFNNMRLSTSLLIKPGTPKSFSNMTVNQTSSDPANSSKRTTFYFMLLD